MAAFCHFWRMTPPQFWALSVAEYQAMLDHMRTVMRGAE